MTQGLRHWLGLPRELAPAAVLDAATVRHWLALALETAEAARKLVNSFNVFPVPDTDTGTNVVLTLRSAVAALGRLPAEADVVQATAAAADGAVRGARGNSGLLVSQSLAALAEVAAQAPQPSGLRPVEMTRAYERMASSAWDAVSHPVPGTLLSVADDAAKAAREFLGNSSAQDPVTLGPVVMTAALAAQESVVETGGLGHGPVDAGAAALMLMHTALCDVVGATEGQFSNTALQMLTALADGAVTHAATHPGTSASADSTGEFEVMYLLEAAASQASSLRTRLERIGDSVGVVGTPDALGVGLYQVHVHTDTPRAALAPVGRSRQICIHHLHPTALVTAGTDEPPLPRSASPTGGRVFSLERMAAARTQDAEEPAATASSPRTSTHAVPGVPSAGLIACTRAPGLIDQLARTGAVVVLNPERDGIVRAAGDLGLGDILVLPCDAQATTQAHDAARALAVRATATDGSQDGGVRLVVADTHDDAEVLAAAVAVAGQGEGLDSGLAQVSRRVVHATAAMRTISFTGARAEAESMAGAVAEALRREDELVTVILGRDADRDVGPLIMDAVAGVGRDVEVVLHAGLQATPDVLVAFE